MNQPLNATERLKWLLRSYLDAPGEFDPTPPDTDDTAKHTSTLPGRWAYYTELDTWLRVMRQCHCPNPRRPALQTKHLNSCMRHTHWHLNERYIKPHARTELIPWTGKITYEKNGRARGLPPNHEPAAPTTVVYTTKRSVAAFAGHTMIARWPNIVSRTECEHGLTWLLNHMHAGRTDRICLPPDLHGATAEFIVTTKAA